LYDIIYYIKIFVLLVLKIIITLIQYIDSFVEIVIKHTLI